MLCESDVFVVSESEREKERERGEASNSAETIMSQSVLRSFFGGN